MVKNSGSIKKSDLVLESAVGCNLRIQTQKSISFSDKIYHRAHCHPNFCPLVFHKWVQKFFVQNRQNFHVHPILVRLRLKTGDNNTSMTILLRACLFHCKTSQVVSRKMRMKKVNCSRENILCFTVFG